MMMRLSQMRPDIGKTYDEIKNKLSGQKVWASSPTVKAIEATFICLAHNLMVLQEHRLPREEKVANTSEIKRKVKGPGDAMENLTAKKQVRPWPQLRCKRLTRCSV